MRVSRVRVEHAKLLRRRAYDQRMRMPDVRDVVVRVYEPAPVIIEQILCRAADDLHRIAIGDAEIPAEALPSRGKRRGLRWPGRRLRFHGNAEQPRRIGTERKPEIALRRTRHARIVCAEVEQVGHHLKVEMRRPSAVYVGRAELRDPFALRYPAARVHAVERIHAQVAVDRERGRERGVAQELLDDAQVRAAVEDSYRRLMSLSMETEVRMDTKKKADKDEKKDKDKKGGD